MKKGEFKIKIRTGNGGGWTFETVSGFYSEVFGVHKTSPQCFTVTHLRTGLRLASFDFLRQARTFVARVEEYKDWPVPWDCDSGKGMDYKPNASIALNMVTDVRYYS